MIGDLVLSHRITGGRSKNAVNGTSVITKPRQLHLDGLDLGTVRLINVIVRPVVIVGVNVCVIIVRVIVVRIVWQIIPWEISCI